MFEHINFKGIASVTVERIEDTVQLRRALGIIRHRAHRLQEAEVPPFVRDELARIEWLSSASVSPRSKRRSAAETPDFRKLTRTRPVPQSPS